MALIARFEQRPLTPKRIHEEVLCGYNAVQIGQRQILQLETYGSTDRKIPGKVSQSIQLDEGAARDLITIIRTAFPGVG
jgi:hypothetical protein